MMRCICLLFFVVFLVGCECGGQHDAHVFDVDTKTPIQGAKISAYKTWDGDETFLREEHTDSNGFYSISYFSGSGFSKCPQLKIYIRKDDYKMYTVTNTILGEEDTIYLEKE